MKTGRPVDDTDIGSEDRDEVADVNMVSYIDASEQTRQSQSYMNFSSGPDTYADTQSELNKMTLSKKGSIMKKKPRN